MIKIGSVPLQVPPPLLLAHPAFRCCETLPLPQSPIRHKAYASVVSCCLCARSCKLFTRAQSFITSGCDPSALDTAGNLQARRQVPTPSPPPPRKLTALQASVAAARQGQ
jgi:hypothetical protein